MPILSLDYSRGSVTAIHIKDDLTYSVVKVPSQVPGINYHNKPDEEAAFLSVLKEIEEQFRIKLSSKYKIFVSTVANKHIELPNLSFCNKGDAFKSLVPLDFMYYSHLHVGDNTGLFEGQIDYKKLMEDVFFDEKEETITNYFENLNLYPSVKAGSDRDLYEEMAYLKQIAHKNCHINKDNDVSKVRNIVLSTTRDLVSEIDLCRLMLLATESFCSDQIANFRLDHDNFIGSIAALSLNDNDTFQKIEFPDFLPLGTVINIADDLYCIFSNEDGVTQELRLGKNEVFTLPAGSYDSTKVTINSRKYDVLEKELKGGVFGVIVDTREKKQLHLTYDQKKNLVKEWENNLLLGLRSL